jgi:hypothetical protein
MSDETTPAKPQLRFPGIVNRTDGDMSAALREGGVGGVLLGETCHGHVLTEVYADFDGEGHLVALHTHDIGSC